MANRQIHELSAAGALTPEDQLIVSTASGQLTRRASLADLPWQAGPGATGRRLSDKLAEQVSVKDFGAVGDGVADDAPSFQAALDAHGAVYVPPGTYRLATALQVKPRRRLAGAGRDVTVLAAEADLALSFRRNSGAWRIEPGSTEDWNRSSLADLTVSMTTGGVRVEGHEFFAERLRFRGGAAAGWCLDMVDANECALRDISAGYGGGEDTLLAGGIRWLGQTAGVNYGDSSIEEVSIKLGAAGTTGIRLEHQGSLTSLINNMVVRRVQVNAPASGLTPLAGTIGIALSQVRRCLLEQVDVEVVELGFDEAGSAGGGNSGSSSLVSYVGCHVLNCPTPYRDSNGTLAGSAMRRSFLGGTEVFPLKTGTSSGDVSARAGLGDTLLPAGLWLSEPSNGGIAVQLRSPNVGQLLVTGDFIESGTLPDGHPKKAMPRQALGVDVTSFNVTRLYRPRGYAEGAFSRLALGNGEGHASGPLHRVEVSDPLYLAPRPSEPPQPLNGLVGYYEQSSALPGGTAWIGPGWYTRLADRWQPGVTPMGRVPERERNVSFTVSPLDFGAIHRVNNLGDVTVTISASYNLGAGVQPLMVAGDPAAVFWLVRQGTGAVILAAADSSVELKMPSDLNRVARQNQLVMVVLRHNASTGKIEVYANTVGDGEQLFEEKLGWTSATPTGGNTDANPYVVASSRAGQLLRISSNDDPAHIAYAASSLPAGITAAMFRLVSVNKPLAIIAGSGMTLRRTNGTTTPGGLPCFNVAESGKVVTVHVYGADPAAPQQQNSIYIEG
ncbi:glycosyl hydrolase family 28-related protein [Geminicoccaceae bacterium 1502E]|nr:glycosyl hydrolase family 28-related protein [Geminicoccaceae bacterium 1502E]